MDRELSRRVLQDYDGLLAYCRCGDRFVISAQRRQLLEVRSDGTVRPFRYHKPFGRKWLPSRGA